MNRRLKTRNNLQSVAKRRSRALGQSHLRGEALEARQLLAADVWHNAALPYDVNGDNYVTSLDALIPINELNHSGAGGVASFAKSGMFDVNNDGMLTSLDPLLIINELNKAEGEGEVVRLRLEAVSATTGDPITSVGLSEDFVLRGYVQDLRGIATGGVFAAYMDVTYDPALLQVTGAITHSATYPNGPAGSTATAGLIDEVGSFDGLSALGPDEQLLFSIPMRSGATSGTANLIGDPADVRPAHDVLLFGEVTAVAPTEILFVNTTLTVGDGGTTTPLTLPDAYTGIEDTLLSVTAANGVLANDSVEGGGSLTAAVAVGPSNGTLNLNADGSFTYQPSADFNGSDSFTYIATSGGASAAPTTVSLTISPVNDAPVATGETYTLGASEVFTVLPDQGVLINDFDPEGSPITARRIQGPANGAFLLVPSGGFTYSPNAGFTGTDSFTYVVSDGELDSTVVTTQLIVADVNDAPVAADDAYDVNEDTTLVVTTNGVLANDTDADGDTLQASVVALPSNGSVTLNADGTFNYVPAANFFGTDSFTYRASDGQLTSNIATVTITVASVNDAPVAVNDTYNVVFDAPLTVNATNGVLANDTDVDGDALTATLSSNPANGTVELNANGAFVYTPATGFTGTDSFAYVAFDGSASSGITTVTLVVAPSGPQVAFRLQTTDLTGNPISEIAVGTSFLLQVYVQDTSPETRGVFAAYLDVNFQSALASANGSIIYTETYPNGHSGSTTTAGLIDEAGAFDGFTPLGGDELLLLTVPMRANDGGVVTFVGSPADASPDHDVLLFDDTVPIPVASIDYGTTSLTITGEAVPIAVNDDYAVANNTPLVVNAADGVLSNDIGVVEAGLTASLITGPSNGTLQLNFDGSFSYTPNTGFAGVDSFTYRAVGVADSTNAATVSINVGNLTTGSISGAVYVDADNDGVRDAVELAFGGVTVELLGTDLFGNPVSRQTTSARDGSYFFGGLLAGNYVVRETTPALVIDGKDTHEGVTSDQNDAFIIELNSGTNGTGYNFGERGLRPEFIGNPSFFSSTRPHGVAAAITADGEQSWYCIDEGWDDMLSVTIRLSDDASTVFVNAVDFSGNLYSGTIATAGNRNVRVMGNAASGHMVRLIGTASDFALQQVQPAAVAVDAVFAQQ